MIYPASNLAPLHCFLLIMTDEKGMALADKMEPWDWMPPGQTGGLSLGDELLSGQAVEKVWTIYCTALFR